MSQRGAVGGPDGNDGGQATIELALAMPVLCLLLLAVVQLAVVVRDQLAVIEAARAGARAASVSADPATAAARAVHAAVGAGLPEAAVSTSMGARTVTVTVTMREHTDVPMIGALLPDIEVRASATMILEPP